MLQTFLHLMKKINYKGTKYRTEGLTILLEFCFFPYSSSVFCPASNLGQRLIFLLGTLLADLKCSHNMHNNNMYRKITLKHWKWFSHA